MHLAASSEFHRRPRPRAVAWIPPELRRRFHRWQANGFLDALSHVHRAHPVPVTSAASKRYSPHEAVAHGTTVSHRAVARCSPGSCPSRAFLRSSLGPFVDPVDHSVHRGASTANVGEGYSPPSGETAAILRSRRPRRRVRPALRTRIGPCRLSATTLPPSTFRLASELVCPGPRRFEGLDQRPICERWVALLGFSASSATSRFRASRRPSRRAAPFGAAVSPVS